MILVTTAGKVGSEVALLLAQREVGVRVLVRDPEKAKALADAGAEIAVGDLSVPARIDAAMAGVTGVVLVSPAVPAEELNVVASAARAGVAHIVKVTSKASADSPIARRRWQTEIEAGRPPPEYRIRCCGPTPTCRTCWRWRQRSLPPAVSDPRRARGARAWSTPATSRR